MSDWRLPGTVRLLLWCLLALAASGCAGVKNRPVVWQEAGAEAVWPQPPAAPRIRFLRSLSGPGDFREQVGLGGRLARWFTGKREDVLPMQGPYGVTADGRGRVWVADPGSRAIHVFDLGRREVEYYTTAGSYAFASPVGVAWDDSRERLYVADSGLNSVFVLDSNGGFIAQRAGPDPFVRPTSVALDSHGTLFVLDSKSATIEVFGPEGDHLRTIGRDIPGFDGFNAPSNLAVGRDGLLYVTDAFNFRIVVLSPEGELVTTIGALGDAPGSFARPRGVAVDSEGHVYVADAAFDNIQLFDMAGQLLLYFGGAGKQGGQFCLPAGVFVDAEDRIYVADACNYRIQVFQYLPAAR